MKAIFINGVKNTISNEHWTRFTNMFGEDEGFFLMLVSTHFSKKRLIENPILSEAEVELIIKQEEQAFHDLANILDKHRK